MRSLRVSLAPPLAAALLGGDWTRAGLEHRATQLLGGRPPGLARLVGDTLRTFHVAPRHELRVLAAFLAERGGFWRRLAREGGALRLASVVPAVVGMAPQSLERAAWHLPRLETERDLASFLEVPLEKLGWFAASLEGKPWHGRADHYRHHFVPKAPGAAGMRLLEAPMSGLKAVKRRLLHGLLDRVPPHAAAQGFVPGRSVLDHARAHAGRAAVLCLDLEDFFASVSSARVFGVFHGADYPEGVSRRLAELCTHRTPGHVFLHLLPPATTADAARRARQRARHRDPHLPQGAPTSPALANLVAFRLDRRLAALAAKAGATYTRYADDLAFSGDAGFAHPSAMARFARLVALIVRDEGFRLNATKTRRMGQAQRQSICGVVVNKHPNLARREYDRLKATLHNCVRHGPATQNGGGEPDLRAHLLGRVAWATQVNPKRGAKLRAIFDRIAW